MLMSWASVRAGKRSLLSKHLFFGLCTSAKHVQSDKRSKWKQYSSKFEQNHKGKTYKVTSVRSEVSDQSLKCLILIKDFAQQTTLVPIYPWFMVTNLWFGTDAQVEFILGYLYSFSCTSAQVNSLYGQVFHIQQIFLAYQVEMHNIMFVFWVIWNADFLIQANYIGSI